MLFLLLACTGSPVDDDGDGAASDLDCDDADAAVHPGAADDTCDGVDQDCDGRPDDASPDLRVWYPDADGDGFGAQEAAFVACAAPEGATADFLDCDDADPDVHPGAPDDTCDGVDTDCDGSFDEDSPDATSFHADADGDGYGAPYELVVGCTPPYGSTDDGTDCDDRAAEAHPGGDEVCGDGIDGDCDGVADAGCGGQVRADLGVFPRFVGGDDDFVSAELGGEMALAFGDADGDGRNELAVGFPWSNGGAGEAGRIYLVSDVPAEETPLADRAWLVEGGDADARAGWSVAFLRDADGDGRDELLVAVPGIGGACVLGNALGTAGLADAEATLVGVAVGAWSAVADAGTILGEGAAIAVGAPDADDAGAVYLVAAPVTGDVRLADARAVLRGDTAFAGAVLAGAGDLDGDGVDDLVVGDRSWLRTDGAAWIVLGPVEGALSLADADGRFAGEPGSDGLAGAGVAGPGDLDGDGLDDAVIAAPEISTAGSGFGEVYVFAGPSTGSLTRADAEIRYSAAGLVGGLGYDVGAAGDVDGDGREDLRVGVSSLVDPYGFVGGALLFTSFSPGTYDPLDARVIAYGPPDGGWFGGIGASGDLDGDGVLELATGGTGDAFAGMVTIATPSDWL